MKSRDTTNIQIIHDSLTSLGLAEAAQQISFNLNSKSSDDLLANIALAFKSVALEKDQIRATKLLGRSRLGSPYFFSDLIIREDRELDLDYIKELQELHFIEANRNLVVWGPSGTGKTWIAKAIATEACMKGIRTRWIRFPDLYRQLKYLDEKGGTALNSKFKYYCKFPLLCIDEFPNADLTEAYILQEFFDLLGEAGNSVIVCSQSNPENWDQFFPVLALDNLFEVDCYKML